jgi:SapC protein
MTRHVLLNNVEHRDLRIITRRGTDLGDDLMYALTFPAEFRDIQAYYPIVFAKAPDGKFIPLALLGFRDKQNLFLNEGAWDAPYLPLMVERVPFLIGNGPNGKVVHIDLDSPRVSRTEGERLFLEHGGNSEFLDRVTRVMGTIDEGIAATPGFVAALEEHNLIESFVLDVQFRDGAQHRFTGFYAIQEERLAKLGADVLAALHQRGYLQAIYMVIASVSNFRALIERVNKLNAGDR